MTKLTLIKGHGEPPPPKADSDVLASLQVTEEGKTKPTLANIQRILRDDPRWKDKVAFDLFARSVTIDGSPLTDPMITDIQIDIGTRYEIEPAKGKVSDVLHLIAHDNAVNPLMDYLESLEWDGKKRLDRWLTRTLRVEDTALHRAFARRWCISAVARAYQPGCQVDTVLLVVGQQGVRKSPLVPVPSNLLKSRSFS